MTARRWSAVFWAALLIPVALSICGFRSGTLLREPLWDDNGLRRVAVFAGVYAMWSAAFLPRPQWFAPATAAVCAVFTMVAVGPAALLAVCLFAAAAFCVGDLLARGKTDAPVAILLGAAVYATGIGLFIALPIQYPALYLALFAAPVITHWRALLRRVQIAWAGRPRSAPGAYAASALLVFFLCLHWLVTLKPDGATDAVAMHLAIPARVAMDHRWAFDFSHIVWAVMPMNANWCYTGVYLLGGEFAARLLNLGFFLVIVWILARTAGRLAAILFASVPLVQLVTGSLMVENFWTALLAGSAVCLWRGQLLFGGLLGGVAVASKFGAAGFAVPLGVIGLAQLARRGQWRTGLAWVAVFAAFAAPPYVNAWARTGNPVYPFANATFHAPYIETKESLVDTRFQEPVRWSTPFDLTFHTSRFFEGEDGSAGFQHLLLLPLALMVAMVTRNRWSLALAAVCLLFALVTFRAQSNLRYLYPAMAGSAVVIATAITQLGLRDRLLHRASLTVAGGAVALNLWFLPSSTWAHHDFFSLDLLTDEGRRQYLEQAAPARPLVDQLNREGYADPVAFFETPEIAGLRAKAYVNGWHNWIYWRTVMGMRSSLDYLQYAQTLNLRRYIAPADLSGGGFAAGPVADFLKHFTDRETVSGRLALYRLNDAFTGPQGYQRAQTVELASHTSTTGVYDSPDPRLVYDGAWTFDYQFTEAANGTLAYTNQAGATAGFAFNGTSLQYLYTKAVNRGIAEVVIDGRTTATVDLYSPQTQWRASTQFRGLQPGRHEVIVRVTGRHNQHATDAFVDVDALVVE